MVTCCTLPACLSDAAVPLRTEYEPLLLQVAVDGDTLKIGVDGQEITPQDEEVCASCRLHTPVNIYASCCMLHMSAAHAHSNLCTLTACAAAVSPVVSQICDPLMLHTGQQDPALAALRPQPREPSADQHADRTASSCMSGQPASLATICNQSRQGLPADVKSPPRDSAGVPFRSTPTAPSACRQPQTSRTLRPQSCRTASSCSRSL
jgi:hypothetical protein